MRYVFASVDYLSAIKDGIEVNHRDILHLPSRGHRLLSCQINSPVLDHHSLRFETRDNRLFDGSGILPYMNFSMASTTEKLYEFPSSPSVSS